MGTPAAALAAPGAPNSGFGTAVGQVAGQVGGLTPQGPAGTQPASPGNPPATSGNPVSADQGTDTSSDADPPIPSDDASPIIGGNIIGVGSKINRKSVIVYDHAKNYRLFEFIWDPSKDMLDRKSTRLNSSHGYISYAVFCLIKNNMQTHFHKS